MEKKNISTTVNLLIRTYKIPAKVEGDKVVELTTVLTPEMVIKEEKVTIDRSKENLALKIQEYSKKISNSNRLQENITLSGNRDYINKQILTKE